MKAASVTTILLSLAAGVAARGATARGDSAVVDAASAAVDSSSRPLEGRINRRAEKKTKKTKKKEKKETRGRGALHKRKLETDHPLHDTITKRIGRGKKEAPAGEAKVEIETAESSNTAESSEAADGSEGRAGGMTEKKTGDMFLQRSPKGSDAEGRRLKKTKTHDRFDTRSDDDDDDDDRSSSSDYYDDDYSGSGKSGKSGGGGKSGKSGGGSKSGKSGGGGKSGKSGGGGGGGGGDDDDYYYYEGSGPSKDCRVTITNLSYDQAFSEIFVMTAEKDVTKRRPVFIYGNRTTEELAELAQDAKATGIERRYKGRRGVRSTQVVDDFGQDDKFLKGGGEVSFKVKGGGFLTVAAGLPFTNDGAMVLQGRPVRDGATYFVDVIDVGAEGNVQTCWSLAADRDDFEKYAPQSICADEDLSDDNDNRVPGENFVHMHRGVHDFDEKSDLESLLLYDECKDWTLLENCADGDGQNCFARYFFNVGYDDEVLLCSSGNDVNDCNLREDDDFLKFINKSSQFDGEDDNLINIAMGSTNFEDFCDELVDVNKDIEDAFQTIEPIIFDWRNAIAKIHVDCSGNDDDDDYDDDDYDDDYSRSGKSGKTGRA